MVRATAAEVLKLFGGVYPPGHDATSFGNYAAHTDAELDMMALPGALSTTGTNEVALANRECYLIILHSLWASAGGTLSGMPEPISIYNPRYYKEVKSMVLKLLAGTTYGGTTTIDMVG